MRVLADKNTSLSRRILKQKTAMQSMTELIRSDREERRAIYGALSSELNQTLQKNARQRVVLATLSRSESQLDRRKVRSNAATSAHNSPEDIHSSLRERYISAALAACRCRHGCGLRTCALNDLGLNDRDLEKVRSIIRSSLYSCMVMI